MGDHLSATLSRRHRQAFTLIELIVVTSIIVLLIAMLLPALSEARESAYRIRCLSNLRQFGIAMFGYTAEHDGFYPQGPRYTADNGNTYELNVTAANPTIAAGGLGFYRMPNLSAKQALSMNEDLFWCPSDSTQYETKFFDTTPIIYKREPDGFRVGYTITAGKYYHDVNGTGRMLWSGPRRDGEDPVPRLMLADLILRRQASGQERRFYTHRNYSAYLVGNRWQLAAGPSPTLKPDGGNEFFTDGHGEWVPFDGVNSYGVTWNRIQSEGPNMTPWVAVSELEKNQSYYFRTGNVQNDWK